MRRHRLAAALAAASVALLVTGCQSGPVDVADGYYRTYAWSGETPPQASMVVTDEQIVLTTDAGDQTVPIGDPAEAYTLCPPDGSGRPRLLHGVLTLGDLVLTQPAVFGDCGTAKPRRLTVVDLASYDPSVGPFSFTEWVEFCDLADPDCS